MSKNLALLSKHEQRLIELDKQASYLVYRLRRKEISRADVKAAIENTHDDREYFRDAVNLHLHNQQL